MRLNLSQSLRTEQRLVQSPQMIQAMKILQCPMQELKEQIEQELDENILLEVIENTDAPQDGDSSGDPGNGSTTGTSTETGDAPPSDGFPPEAGSSESSSDVSFEESMEVRIGRELDNLEERTEPIGRRSV
ncbi:MAG: hypothetical protein ACYST0_04625, partial [Planctomycetota bacterium]